MPTDTPRVLVCIADGSEEIEAIAPGDILVRCGCDVTYAGVGGLSLSGSRGVPLRAEIPIERAAAESWDLVVVPGGDRGAKNLSASETLNGLLLAHAGGDKWLGAICAAPAVVLAPLGLTDNKHVTCYPGYEDRLPDSARHTTDAVVVDGELVTSRGPGTAIEFGLMLGRLVVGDDEAEAAASGMLL